ncbi:hypothetical protein EDB81DRAFT_180419 [Dactylonectria macrodidyma]|uniref:SET domain-containing protein n=1 Tax=Dactylonectria macrodidyma TaxID=307937 RepID=A0A9P9FRV5_9HYPO|nr:hypothetical protein EDB81DRAFT_180419 [Dactylonectria macrodidyma]
MSRVSYATWTLARSTKPALQSIVDATMPSRRHTSSSSAHDCSIGGCEAGRSPQDEVSSMESLDASSDSYQIGQDKASSLPRNKEATYISSHVNRGRCVHLNQDFPRGHCVIVEKPAISCVHWRQRQGRRTIGDMWDKLSHDARLELQQAFKKLEDIPINKKLNIGGRKLLEKFVEEYAFWDSKNTNAHVYAVASHINHACTTHANAQQWTDSDHPNCITVTLVRDMKAGEELFINYNKGRMRFGCAVGGSRCDEPRYNESRYDEPRTENPREGSCE